MNKLWLILGIILVVIIVVVCVVMLMKNKKNDSELKSLGVDVLNSVYGTDGYFVYYVPLIDVFKNLVNIANIDPNYLQIESGNGGGSSGYKLKVYYKGSLNYVTCSIVDENDVILAESDFEMKYIDASGVSIIKDVSENEFNIGHNKSVILNISDSSLEVKNNSWTKSSELEFKYNKSGEDEFIIIE